MWHTILKHKEVPYGFQGKEKGNLFLTRRNMIYLRYLNYLLKHKLYVFLACVKYKIVWRGVIHDMSKFLPSEFIPYAKHFHGKIDKGRDNSGYYKPTNSGNPDFEVAWRNHFHRN